MNFSTADRVLRTIRAGDEVERIRSENRVKINNAANCVPLIDTDKAKKIGLKINVNFGQLMADLAEARRQLLSAFWSNSLFFKVNIPLAPADHQSEWESFITETINTYLRESMEYFELHDARWTSVVSHGVGPMIWRNPDDWCADYIALSDLRIPTDTVLSHKNLDWFAELRRYTPGELLDEAFRKGKGNRWDKKAVIEILKNYKEVNFEASGNSYNWDTDAEKLAELARQDGAYYQGAAMPVIPLWHFYFKDTSDPKNSGWFMRVVPETGVVKGVKDKEAKFLWTGDTPEAAKLEHLLHVQYGDISNDAPPKHSSVRSLGHALLEPTFWDNLTVCRLLQHIHDNFNIWLRSADPADKARAQVQEFGNLGIVKPGMSVIPKSERHQIEAVLVQMGMSQMKQREQRVSSTYNQSPDSGTQREQTAFETRVKVEQLNAMLSGILLRAFIYEKSAYREQCRRFCRQKSANEQVQDFLAQCRRMQIPSQWLNVKYWRVEPVTPLGMGNPTLAQAAANQLLEIMPLYDPSAQREILHEATLAITKDPRKAARWVQLGKKRATTDASLVSQTMFGTLMSGVEIMPPEGLSPVEQIEAMLPLLAGKIVMCEKRDNMATPDEIMGFSAVEKYLTMLIQRLAMNKNEKARVVEYGKTLGKLMNQVKGLAQRGQEQRQKNNGNGGMNAESMAKINAMMMQAAAKARASEIKAETSERMKEQQFVRDQRREDAKAVAEIDREKTKNAILLANKASSGESGGSSGE